MNRSLGLNTLISSLHSPTDPLNDLISSYPSLITKHLYSLNVITLTVQLLLIALLTTHEPTLLPTGRESPSGLLPVRLHMQVPSEAPVWTSLNCITWTDVTETMLLIHHSPY